MQIVNSEINLPKTSSPSSEYIENCLKQRAMRFIRWAIVAVDEDSYTVNVSHCLED